MQSTHIDSNQIPRRAWVVLAAIIPSVLLVVIDASIVNVAFPVIGEDLNASDGVLSWIITGYSLAVASLLLIAGRMADRLGRRRVFLMSVGLFTIGSLLCGISPNAGWLIAFRVMQGVGGAAIFPSSLALVLPEFPYGRRSTPIGIWAATAGLGAVIGPPVGALLIELFGWRGIFWVNIPVGVAIVLVGRRVITESRAKETSGRLDMLSVPVGVAGVALLLVALVQGEQWGYVDVRTLLMLSSGLLMLPILVVRSMRHPQPLLDLSLFRIRSFWVSTVSTIFFGMAFLAGFLVNTLLLQRLWDWPIWKTGLGLMASPVMSVASSTLAGAAADRIGHRWLTFAGGSLCCLSFGIQFWRIGDTPDYFSDFFPAAILLGLGAGLAISCLTSGALSEVRPDQFSMGNATARTIQQLFYSVGVAVVVSMLGKGSKGDALGDYRGAWIWIMATYFVSALLMAVFFPVGTAASRGALGKETPSTAPAADGSSVTPSIPSTTG